jgi:predicted O-methyltransferase YrrM
MSELGLVPFDVVAEAVGDTPFMSREQGRIVYDHIRETKPSWVLELGTAHGVGAAYMAAALEPGARLITVDFQGADFRPGPAEVLARAGVSDRVEIVHQFSSYNWWLKEEIERGEPRFDFVYLDGSKNWTIDGLAVFLIEKVLRPGGWLLMDDLNWSYSAKETEVTDGVVIRDLSEPERAEPHLSAVFELLVKQHPSFVEMRILDDWWGWARKRTDGDVGSKTLEIQTSRSLRTLLAVAVMRVARAVRLKLGRRRNG